MSAPKKYYSVHRGRKRGVFLTWEECKLQVHEYSNARFKSFQTYEEAKNFMETGMLIVKPKKKKDVASSKVLEANMNEKDSSTEVSEQKSNNSSVVKVYTDGCSRGNNSANPHSRAGIGVWFGDGDERNLAERLVGRQTNQRAELMAVIRALEVIPSEKNVHICTDSMYTIKCATIWYDGWKARGFKTSKNNDVENLDLVQRLRKSIDDRIGYVKFQHVRGHRGIYGNEEADRLANEGATLPLPGLEEANPVLGVKRSLNDENEIVSKRSG